MKIIGLIGGGQMGEAILKGLPANFRAVVCELNSARQTYLRRRYHVQTGELPLVIEQSSVLILAVKPQDMEETLAAIAFLLTKKILVISIAAGKTTRYIESHLGPYARVVRVMPNLPALVGASMTAVCRGKSAQIKDVQTACQIFNRIGQTLIVEERLMNAVTAVSGSGPGYIFYFVECLTQAALKLGLSQIQSEQLVLQTLRGSALLLEKTGEATSQLRAKVTSKGGTTQAAMDVFMARHIEKIFIEALTAARNRARELAK